MIRKKTSVFLFFMVMLLTINTFFSPTRVNALDEEAILAGGCFWCLEHDLEGVPGVLSVESGYSGGYVDRPSYEQVSSQRTGHQESVKVSFDNEEISYANLLRIYMRNIDPLDGEGQFCDRGDSYRPVIFARDDEQQRQAILTIANAAKEIAHPVQDIKVVVENNAKFWLAEDYHQDFAERNSLKYNFYRASCGRDYRLDRLWGKRARTGDPWQQ